MAFGEIIDSAVGLISPEAATRRKAFRALGKSERFGKFLNYVQGGGKGKSPYYRGQRNGRSLGDWKTDAGTANQHINAALPDLRNDSNDLLANNAIAKGALDTYCTNIVGKGLQMCSNLDYEYLGMTPEQADDLQDAIEREYELFIKTADQTRTRSPVEMQRLVLLSVLGNGDVFCNLPMKRRNGIVYETMLNLIEGHRICTKAGLPESDRLTMGVELDELGCPTGYQYVSTADLRKPREWRRLKAFDDNGHPLVLHIFRKQRVGQNRGVPLLAPVIELVKKLDTYGQAEVDAAVINAFLTVFIKKKTIDDESGIDVVSKMGDETGAQSTDDDLKLGSGTIIEMLDDEEDVKIVDPQRPNVNFQNFFKSVVAEIAVGLNLPFEVLMKTFQSSYSASRGALLEAIKVFEEWERFLIDAFCQPVFETFMMEAVAKGRIEAPGFFEDPLIRMAYCKTLWIGPAPGELDPTKAVNAATARMANGTSNLDIETQARGYRMKDVMRGAERAKRLAQKHGLKIDFIVENEPDPVEQTDLETLEDNQ